MGLGGHQVIQRLRNVSPTTWADFGAIVLLTYVIFWALHPSLLFSTTTVTGGDMGAHVAMPAYMHDHLGLPWHLTSWYPGWFAGMPLYTYYFVLPDLFAALASFIIPFTIAMKLATVAGSLIMPLSAYVMGRCFRAPRPIPVALAAGTLPFLFSSAFTIDGGNLFSTLAGEYPYSLSLSFAMITIGLFARGMQEQKGRWLAATMLSLTLAAHVLPWFFAIAGIGILWVRELMTRRRPNDARANQAAVIVPFILGGAMGPVTNAGAIAQAHAETMVGCAMTQLERPGAPVIYGNFLSSMSLRSGSPTFGTPEPAIGSMVVGQLARRLNLPLRCAGSFTTSKLPDGQAMQESVMSMLSAVHCGANFILHSAGFLDGLLSMSYEKFMLDADFCGALHSYIGGVTVDDNTLAMDAFHNVTPGGHYLGSAHTMANYTTAFFDSNISDDTPFETWTEAGQTDAATRANKRWKQSLAEYVAPELDVAVDESIRDFMDRKKASMPDQWY